MTDLKYKNGIAEWASVNSKDRSSSASSGRMDGCNLLFRVVTEVWSHNIKIN